MVFAKARAPRPHGPASTGQQKYTWVYATLMVALVAVAVAIWTKPPRAPRALGPQVAPTPRAQPSSASLPAEIDPVEPPVDALESPSPDVPPPDIVPPPSLVTPPTLSASAFPPRDEATFARLEHVVGRQATIADADVRAAEDLHARYPMPAVVALLERVFVLAGRQAQASGRLVDAGRLYTRATELLPDSPRVWPLLLQFLTASKGWREAELAARRGISARPGDASIHRALAMALMMQDRNDEAAEVLRRALAQGEDSETRSLLDRLQGELDAGRGMTQRNSSHFRVRFEGASDDALGAALVRMLEEKYTMLARTFGHEPEGEIPVILYPMEAFRGVTSAPGWAGASYSHFDGRIRIGTRGLSVGFVPLDLERTITHELVHAFVAGISRGNAPRDINEGLAQYHSGRRLGYRLSRSRATDGRGVDDFYDAALSFVEYLLDKYRQSSMNDALTMMGEKGTHEAFRRAYGQGYEETRAEWIRQLE